MKKDSHNPKTLIKSGNMPKVLTSLLTNAIIGYRFAQNGKNVSEKPHDKRFFEVHFCLQLQPTRPVGDKKRMTFSDFFRKISSVLFSKRLVKTTGFSR